MKNKFVLLEISIIKLSVMKKSTFLLTTLLLITNLHGQSDFNNDLLEDYVDKHGFNGSILVHTGDIIIYHENFGLANREFNIPITDSTIFKIASVTKIFTSVLILQLYENDEIDLNEHISTYLPNYSGEAADKVTILQLLTATSGIESMEKEGDAVYEKKYDTDEILEIYCNGKLENIPGKKFNYNNADYVILGKIIEKIYGQTFGQVLNEKLLFPLDMEKTGLLEYEIINRLASSYWWNDSIKRVERDIPYYPENYFTSGAMYSSITDLMKFSNALFGYKILSKNTMDIFLKPNQEAYACGLWVFEINSKNNTKLRIALRPGNIWGTKSGITRILNKNISIIIMSNMMGTSSRWDMEKLIIDSLNL